MKIKNKSDFLCLINQTINFICKARSVKSTRSSLTIPVAFIALLLAKSAHAVVMTEAEYVLLPEYCKAQSNVSEVYYTKYFSLERTRQWQSAFGSNYINYHHYCWSLVSIARAYRPSSSYGPRTSIARLAIADINYIIERATSDFILLPEIYTKQGEAYLLLRDDRNAEMAFRKAWEINPAYWRPYVWWGQRLLQLGRLREARLVVEEGLKNAPGTKALDQLSKDINSSRSRPKK